MAYYGDPETLKAATEALSSLAKNPTEFDEYIERVDGFAKLAVESHLASLMSDWPDPDGTNKNAISLLWLYKMTELMKRFKTASNTLGATDAEGDWAKTEYDLLLSQMRSGSVVVPGASYYGFSVKERAGVASNRLVTQAEDQYEQKSINDLFLRGLRQ